MLLHPSVKLLVLWAYLTVHRKPDHPLDIFPILLVPVAHLVRCVCIDLLTSDNYLPRTVVVVIIFYVCISDV